MLTSMQKVAGAKIFGFFSNYLLEWGCVNVSAMRDFFLFFSLGNYGEVIIKTPDEYWITGKSSNEREFYVIIQEKNANLKEISGKLYLHLHTYIQGI